MFNVIFLINSDWVLLFVRIVLGVVMVYYGWPKIKDLKSNSKDFVKMGFKPGWLWGTAIALVEFVGGIAMLIGFLVEIAAFELVYQLTLICKFLPVTANPGSFSTSTAK